MIQYIRYIIDKLYSIMGIRFYCTSPERFAGVLLLPSIDKVQAFIRSEIILESAFISHSPQCVVGIDIYLASELVLVEMDWIPLKVIQVHDVRQCFFYNFHKYASF